MTTAEGYDDSFEYAPGKFLENVHSPKACAGRACVVHDPSDHCMRDLPLHWRQRTPFDIKPSHFERVCVCGTGHPDPDDAAYHASIGQDISMHGCGCLCCSELIAAAMRGDAGDAAEVAEYIDAQIIAGMLAQ